MNISNIVKNSFTCQKAEEVHKLCEPLFKAFNLNYFVYAKMYHHTSEMLLLLTDKDFCQYYYENEYKLMETAAPSGIHTWDQYMPNQAIQDGAKYFQHYNGLVILKNHPDFIEKIEIASSRSNQYSATNLCFNYPEALNRFMLYFKEKGRNLIKYAYQEKFLIPKVMQYKAPKNKKLYKEFINEIKTKKNHLNNKNKEVILSPREYDCLSALSKNKTIKEVASKLNLSPKTVEEYITNAKKKAGCYSRTQLIEFFYDNLPIK